MRDYSEKHKKVKRFLDNKIREYKHSKNFSHILFPHLIDKLPGKYSLAIYDADKEDDVTHITTFNFIIINEKPVCPQIWLSHKKL
ncbi:MAG: hypothetical protein ABUK01_17910 [Leptospirales bacterium]